MGLQKKEKKAFVDGLVAARNIVAMQGMQGLEIEIGKQCRGMGNSTVTSRIYSEKEKTDLARSEMENELVVLATALATTVAYRMELPASMTMEFLETFNGLVDIYRADKEELEKADRRLRKDQMLNRQTKRYLEGAKKAQGL